MVEQKVIAASNNIPVGSETPVISEPPVARGFIPDRLRSSRSPANAVSLQKPGHRFWGRCAPQRGGATFRQVPSPQGINIPPKSGWRLRSRASHANEFANNGAARKGRRFVLCLPLETL
ncbi:hypothetical protein EJA70_31580 [Pseudomonas sp. PB103]|nr:hypothetical protein EJA70_31580 [Pseudomonas sp. PB103]